jgi:hypothetical protein
MKIKTLTEVNYSRNLWIPNMDNFDKSYSNAVVTYQPNYDPKKPQIQPSKRSQSGIFSYQSTVGVMTVFAPD